MSVTCQQKRKLIIDNVQVVQQAMLQEQIRLVADGLNRMDTLVTIFVGRERTNLHREKLSYVSVLFSMAMARYRMQRTLINSSTTC